MLDDFEHHLFRVHYLLGADWRLCCRQLKMDRGKFFHHVYLIESRLGRVFAELAPYSLYPVSEYFSGTTRRDVPRATVTDFVRQPASREPSRLPLSA
jgi:hypothetical protein